MLAEISLEGKPTVLATPYSLHRRMFYIMAEYEHLEILHQGTTAWNTWREKNPSIRPDLRQADLASASYQGLNLADADLRKANLEHINFQKANLEKADLQGANLGQANLLKANLKNAILREATLREANLTKAILENSNLEHANMTGATFSYANLRRSNLSNCNALGAKFDYADLRRCTGSSAVLRGTNFNHADLRRTNLQEAKLDRAIFHGAVLTKASLHKSTLQHADLSTADLQYANLQETILEGANFYLSDLRRAQLDGAHLPRTLLTGALLQETILCQANLEQANLETANLQEANLFQANLNQAILDHTNLSEANLEESTLTEANLTNAQAIRANLHKANLSGAVLDGANFRKANLSHASMNGIPKVSHTTVANTSFGMANLTGTKLPTALNGFRETLKNLEDTAKHARMLHAWLVGICLFSLLTIITTPRPSSKFDSMQLMLPFFQVEIAQITFLLGVPILGLFIFVYFHFYLSHLYQSLATLPSYFPDGLSLRQRLYPWIINLCIHEWQIQSLRTVEQMMGKEGESSNQELSDYRPWLRKGKILVRLLRTGILQNMIFSHLKTGFMVFLGWGLLPLTIGVLTYPLLVTTASPIAYILLGFLSVSIIICFGSCASARCTARGEKIGHRWFTPVAISLVLVLSGLIMTNQGLDPDNARMAQNISFIP